MSRPYMSPRRWVSLGLVATALAAALAPLSPTVIERWYSLGLYPPLERAITPFTNRLPFAILDLLLVAAAVGLVAGAVRTYRQARRSRSLAPVGHALVVLVTTVASMYLLFLLLWGMNYRRVPMMGRVKLDARPAEAERVLALGLDAVRQMNALYAEAHRIGWNEQLEQEDLSNAASIVHGHLTGLAPLAPGRLKRSIVGPYFRWTGVDGMVNPFGLEVIGNPDLLWFERPFVLAHEWAHLAGFADESEANFVGFLTCVRASTPARYGGWLYLYWQIAGEADRAAREQLWAAMDAGPRADVDAVIARVRRGQLPRLRTASWLVYDQYLKANRVEAGVRSYGAVVNLLVRAEFMPEWLPVTNQPASAVSSSR